MSINYCLRPNAIGKNPNEFSASTISNKVIDHNMIIERMVLRGTHLQSESIRPVLELFYKITAEEVANGNSVNLPLIKIRPGISGMFNSIMDRFHVTRHKIKANTSAGLLLVNAMKSATVQKTDYHSPAPIVLKYHDSVTETDNSLITPGAPAILKGEKIKFNRNNKDEGIYFISAEGTETKASIISENTETTTIFIAPLSLKTGRYSLEVRKAFGTTNIVIRIGQLMGHLDVL